MSGDGWRVRQVNPVMLQNCLLEQVALNDNQNISSVKRTNICPSTLAAVEARRDNRDYFQSTCHTQVNDDFLTNWLQVVPAGLNTPSGLPSATLQ